MPKNFLDEEDSPSRNHSFGYLEGFRFGFGMFVAFLLGFLIISGGGWLLAKLLHLH